MWKKRYFFKTVKLMMFDALDASNYVNSFKCEEICLKYYFFQLLHAFLLHGMGNL